MRHRSDYIQAGFRIFSEKSFGSASISFILSTLGVSKGCFYHHFKSKGDFFQAVFIEARNYFYGRCFDELGGINNPVEKLKRLIINFHDTFRIKDDAHPQAWLLLRVIIDRKDSTLDLSGEAFSFIWLLKSFIHNCLDEAEGEGRLTGDIDYCQSAEIITTSLVGFIVLSSGGNSRVTIEQSLRSVLRYVDSLKRNAAEVKPVASFRRFHYVEGSCKCSERTRYF
ncbi:MAG: TetR/AcrR family transcriptional regulator [Deltaproteobacteria bacterium]|nr:TetR/AcrR family transcriptional regulator [Deltaproteobacteria bacterium]